MNYSAPKPPRGLESGWAQPRSLVIFVLIAAFLSITAPVSLGQQSTRVETFTLGPNASVKIENFRGAVRAEVWEGRAVRIVAQKTQPKESPLLASDLMLMSANGDVVVKCNQTGGADRIDLTVYLPAGAHLQVTAGSYPVEVNGSLGSAVIQTMSGDIGYRLPGSAGARVSMHSTRGVVRAALALNVDDRVGLHTLQGTLGDGAAPIMLDSKSGNITLLPGAGIRHVASITDGPYSRPDEGLAQQPPLQAGRGQETEPEPSAAAAERAYRGAQQIGGAPAIQDPDSVLIQPPGPLP